MINKEYLSKKPISLLKTKCGKFVSVCRTGDTVEWEREEGYRAFRALGFIYLPWKIKHGLVSSDPIRLDSAKPILLLPHERNGTMLYAALASDWTIMYENGQFKRPDFAGIYE